MLKWFSHDTEHLLHNTRAKATFALFTSYNKSPHLSGDFCECIIYIVACFEVADYSALTGPCHFDTKTWKQKQENEVMVKKYLSYSLK